ncbi:putative glycoside hydrolase [Tolumonas lignilytica]|uniref:putative glycoside hydrolase n=1 Tax=Tolumonas lignilytica TaxID=1283284 RepID=UPI0004655595|nr:putative glycoside hydrolase [Tolumonas lignilytica]
MNETKKGLLAWSFAAILLSACGGGSNINSPSTSNGGGVTPPNGGDGSLQLFGVGASTITTPRIQSEMDNWDVKPVTTTQLSLASIGAVLINNAGTSDAADVQVTGNGTGTFMLKSDTPIDLSKYASGFIEFQLRAKSSVPQQLSVSIDNEYPNRSSLPIATAVKGTGNWETLTVPISCMSPYPGATAVNLASVHTPFFLDTNQAFNYEITNVKYTLSSTNTPVVDPVTCKSASTSSGSGVNQAPALAAGDAAIYYSGDKSLATDLSSTYPLNSFGGTVTDAGQIVTADFPGNGGVFLGSDTANSDLSAYQNGAMTLDLKVSSYGASPNIQIRMDGTAGPDYGTFFTMDSGKVPADGNWYRCTLPVASLIPAANTSSVQKALYMAGAWDSMSGLQFAFTNVALKSALPSGFDANSPCTQIVP